MGVEPDQEQRRESDEGAAGDRILGAGREAGQQQQYQHHAASRSKHARVSPAATAARIVHPGGGSRGSGRVTQTETPEQALARALLAAQAKRPHEAMGICRDVLAQAPQTAGAFGLLGAPARQEGAGW